ncbi:putative Ig domain-containing protein [Leptospira sp. FAT2]|uniref:putative Ig domain-containing protein n=1 Tax=Leptospira sanjuanensis TaxID=2879643 RepID=UPI001EE8EF52|nr:putative Ig domain-containing protein [Leptospira sanjuanensis]MCG6168932.1 putative Ig domain-containing protein [Leptospira sanjuanensis]MCG6194333.1 putative Ig domain-containing protein [Leptospira sanjuanensis]
MKKRLIVKFYSPLILLLTFVTGCLTGDRGSSYVLPLLNTNLSVGTPNPSNGTGPAFQYSSPSFRFVKNEAITSFTPTTSDLIDHYSISPALPNGMSFNPLNGEIAGTPSSSVAPTSYQITAYNSQGNSSSISLALEVQALNWENQYFLKGSNLLLNHSLGVSVGISNDTIVAGAYGDTAFSGAAYVFRKVGTTWSQEAYLTAPLRTNSDVFGISVAISGDTIVIGAPLEDSNQNFISTTASSNESLVSSGAAYVFRRSGATWNFEAFLKPSNADANDSFGRFVAIDGDTIVVGSPREASLDPTIQSGSNASSDNSGTNVGAAYVFRRVGTTWSQEAYLKAQNPAANDRFGSEIGISGDTIIVGISQDDAGFANSGAAQIFTRVGTTWTREAFLKASNANASDQFGVSVGISGNTVIVGAFGQSANEGAAYIFERTGNNWSEIAILKAPNAEANDQFGKAVAIYGDTVAIASPRESNSGQTILNKGVLPDPLDNGSLNSGAVYVFQKDTNWMYRSFIKTSNADPSDQVSNATGGPSTPIGEYGSLAMYGDLIALGAAEEKGSQTVSSPLAPTGDNAKTKAGAVYVFNR